MSLHTTEGAMALQAACAEPDPGSLAAATRLRARFAPELAAAALAQAALRRRAVAKFGDDAALMFFTADALEQATRPAVARWRAQRLRDAGVRRVVDLGCGIGSDALACARAGLEVTAVELDPPTAEHARANLALAGVDPGNVLTGDAVQLAPGLLRDADHRTCVFLDPARRTERGRTWDLAEVTPPWQFVLDLLAARHSTVVKLGPGVPKQVLPRDVEALWVADGPDVVEASLWRTPDAVPGHAALLLPDPVLLRHEVHEPLPVAPVGRYLLEPHGAVIRAGALAELAPGTWLLDPHVAYLGSDQPVHSRFATCFEVLDVLDANPKRLKAWVREQRVGTLEIKKRALDLDPAELRKRLQPKGPNAATLVLARTVEGTRALVVRRLPR